MRWHLHHGDCVAFMATLPAESVSSVVCDPPYGLGFMGKEFDKLGNGKAQQAWHERWLAEALRVLKPGGHLVAFGGQRTIHRLTVAAEDVGFEIRDTGSWLFYSGFPKSLDVSKALDSAAGAVREVVGTYLGATNIGKGSTNSYIAMETGPRTTVNITAPSTESAKQWQGWGTATKPALEPWVLCRKPLIGTVAETVLRYGTGALNIDACRYRYGDRAWPGPDDGTNPGTVFAGDFGKNGIYGTGKAVACGGHDLGRWPANVYHCPKVSRAEREAGCEHLPARSGAEAVDREEGSAGTKSPGAGAGRTADAVRNHHPTLKPIELMAWLCRLVTQPGGVVLDPFAGSGSCGAAALQGGFRYLGAELDAEYVAIAEARIMHHAGLFGQRKATAGGVL
jgi:DNA modification methylase